MNVSWFAHTHTHTNLDNNKCSQISIDTEDWSNDAKNSSQD